MQTNRLQVRNLGNLAVVRHVCAKSCLLLPLRFDLKTETGRGTARRAFVHLVLTLR